MHSFFDPGSPQARAVAGLWWWMFGIGLVVWLGVSALALYAALAGRGQREADGLMHVPAETHRRLERVVAGGIILTIFILTFFLVYDFGVGRLLAEHPNQALTIDVIGHQWWWEAHYEDPTPSNRAAAVNEIHVPVGEQIQFKLLSVDVIHSFWAPNMNGKRDLIPGYEGTLWFRADTPGIYRGQCAEFCGLQHAKMAFYIIAEPRAQFAAWLAAGATPANPPSDSTTLRGQQVFLGSGCAMCHTIGGTPAKATVGPDLTHFKSRKTIAAGTLANTRENVTRWVMNPAAIKPGVRMPALPFTRDDLHALVSYLEILK
jgi:cytochrome c oxidase subunit 2